MKNHRHPSTIHQYPSISTNHQKPFKSINNSSISINNVKIHEKTTNQLNRPKRSIILRWPPWSDRREAQMALRRVGGPGKGQNHRMFMDFPYISRGLTRLKRMNALNETYINLSLSIFLGDDFQGSTSIFCQGIRTLTVGCLSQLILPGVVPQST